MPNLPDIEKYWYAFGMLFASCFGAPIPEEAVVVYGGVQVGLAFENQHSTLYWGINRPDEIVAAVPGVRLLAWQSPFETASFRQVSWAFRVLGRALSGVRARKYMARSQRYAF
mgnify:CR=1 FL=1